MVITLIGFALGLPGHAEDADWPDQIHFPQVQRDLPPPPSQFPKGENVIQDSEDEKKGFWPFKRKARGAKQPPPTDQQIMRVGPRENPARPDPLLRLAMPIRWEGGVVPGGFYLVQAAAGAEGDRREFTLARQNKVLMRFTAHRVKSVDENLEKTGTPSPISRIPSSMPPPATAEMRVTPDQKAVIIVLKEGEQRYESDPFPVATDQRHILTH